ncbi:MAG: hypothetical protein EZS28_003392 [Streblomastix strix]|uniref:Tyr recombinase domain-containing protein n=1 Tax=Streblomastix strix TaxID=222440 RepID=A0A5J4X1G7_9EUKA|nr:MAG: hypothetical protein EZS28_003392 [Streblomastix strix]
MDAAPLGLGSDSGTESGRSSSSMRPLESEEVKWTSNRKEMEVTSQRLQSISIDSSRSRSDQLNSRFSEQIGQLGRLQYRPTTCTGGTRILQIRAFNHTWRTKSLHPSTISDILDLMTFKLQQLQRLQQAYGHSNLVHNIAIRKLKMDYLDHRTKSTLSQYDGSPPPTQVSGLPYGYIANIRHELLTKFLDAVGLLRQAQALLIGEQKYQSIRRYYYAMATFDDWMKSKQFSIQDVLRMIPGFIISEVMAWFTGQHKTLKSSLNKQQYIRTVQQLIFDREPMYDTPSALTYRATSNFNVVTRKYAQVQDINILFNHWATQPADQTLTNQDQQIKFASLLLSVCFLRISAISEEDINLSNFNFGYNTALLTLSFKTTNALEQYQRTFSSRDNNSCFTVLDRKMETMSITKISELLTLLIKKIGIEGLTTYSIKHASTTMLAEMGLQERDLNVFTNHAPDSKSARNYYVFAANMQVNGIAARLVTIDYGLENQDSTSTNVSQQKKKNEALSGDMHILSLIDGDSMLSSFETLYLPLFNPVFLPNPSSELKVQTSNDNTTTYPFQITPVAEWEGFRFKPIDEIDRAV